MTQDNSLNIKLSNSEISKLKSEIKNNTKATLNLSLNLIGDSNDETDFLKRLLLNDVQISNFLKAFANESNGIRTHNHLVRKRTFNYLVNWLRVRLQNKWLWVQISLLSLKLQIPRLFRARSKEFLNIQRTIYCRFTLKLLSVMIIR